MWRTAHIRNNYIRHRTYILNRRVGYLIIIKPPHKMWWDLPIYTHILLIIISVSRTYCVFRVFWKSRSPRGLYLGAGVKHLKPLSHSLSRAHRQFILSFWYYYAHRFESTLCINTPPSRSYSSCRLNLVSLCECIHYNNIIL